MIKCTTVSMLKTMAGYLKKLFDLLWFTDYQVQIKVPQAGPKIWPVVTLSITIAVQVLVYFQGKMQEENGEKSSRSRMTQKFSL